MKTSLDDVQRTHNNTRLASQTCFFIATKTYVKNVGWYFMFLQYYSMAIPCYVCIPPGSSRMNSLHSSISPFLDRIWGRGLVMHIGCIMNMGVVIATCGRMKVGKRPTPILNRAHVMSKTQWKVEFSVYINDGPNQLPISSNLPTCWWLGQHIGRLVGNWARKSGRIVGVTPAHSLQVSTRHTMSNYMFIKVASESPLPSITICIVKNWLVQSMMCIT